MILLFVLIYFFINASPHWSQHLLFFVCHLQILNHYKYSLIWLVVVSIPKSKFYFLSDYHPIPLSSFISVMLKCHILNYFMTSTNQQFCFHSGFSTETALLSAITYWFSCLNVSTAKLCHLFDLTKALTLYHINLYSILYHIWISILIF